MYLESRLYLHNSNYKDGSRKVFCLLNKRLTFNILQHQMPLPVMASIPRDE